MKNRILIKERNNPDEILNCSNQIESKIEGGKKIGESRFVRHSTDTLLGLR
jgi:hypothetical protein